MELNINNKYRRYNGSSKSWCRATVMPQSFESPFFHSHSNQSQKSFYASSYRKQNRKIFKRSFRNKYACRNFIKNLNKRYYQRFKKNINFKINLRGNKIIYYSGEKI